MNMTLYKTRFGDLEIHDEDVFTFVYGLIGFPTLQRFVLLSSKPDSPFRWLQSLDEPSIAFLVTDPFHYVEQYDPMISLGVAEEIHLTDDTPRMIVTTASIPRGKPEEMTLNLAGPIVMNLVTREGRQVVLEDEAYTTKHRVFQQADRACESVAA